MQDTLNVVDDCQSDAMTESIAAESTISTATHDDTDASDILMSSVLLDDRSINSSSDGTITKSISSKSSLLQVHFDLEHDYTVGPVGAPEAKTNMAVIVRPAVPMSRSGSSLTGSQSGDPASLNQDLQQHSGIAILFFRA